MPKANIEKIYVDKRTTTNLITGIISHQFSFFELFSIILLICLVTVTMFVLSGSERDATRISKAEKRLLKHEKIKEIRKTNKRLKKELKAQTKVEFTEQERYDKFIG